MLNPLLHTSSSAPTSPMLTRSIHVQPASGVQSKAVVGANAIVAAVVARRPRQASMMQRMSRDSSPVGVPVISAPTPSSASSSSREAVQCSGYHSKVTTTPGCEMNLHHIKDHVRVPTSLHHEWS